MLSASNKEIHESQAYRLLDDLYNNSEFPLDKNWVKIKINELK